MAAEGKPQVAETPKYVGHDMGGAKRIGEENIPENASPERFRTTPQELGGLGDRTRQRGFQTPFVERGVFRSSPLFFPPPPL